MMFKAILSGKEHRKDYHIPLKWKGWCRSFFTHNPKKEDPWFAENRLHGNHKRIEASRRQIKEMVGFMPNSNKVKVFFADTLENVI